METMFLHEDDDPVDIRRDNVFKAVFTKETPEARGALSKLVSALIGRDVSILSILANEPPVNNMRERQIRFDINCRAENGELIAIEMSFNPQSFETVRLEYYTTKLFSGQDIKGIGRDYKDLKQAYQIAILAKEQLIGDDEFFHTFEYYDQFRRVSLNGRSRIITLELSKLEKISKKPASLMSLPELWAYYFEYLTDKDKRSKINEIVEQEEGIAMASQVLMTISRDEEERARIMRDEKIELDYQSAMTQYMRMGHAEGLEKGLEKGHAEGLAKGHAEGLEKGHAEGIKIGEKRILDLLKSGKSREEIIAEFEREDRKSV